MDFIDEIRALASRIPGQIEHIQTEEATKSALIMPFIAALGYNVFDPTEVLPEYVADVGTKKGEKVDYAILQDGKPIMLFECKWHGTNLDSEHMSQLFRYFSVTDARIGVLTNGLEYRFYSDLEAPNRMDKKPFLVFDMMNVQESLVVEIKKLTKSAFDIEEIISTASYLKYTRELKRILAEELSSPSDEFVKFFASQVYSGNMTQSALTQFTGIVKDAFNQFIREKINARLKSALTGETAPVVIDDADTGAEEGDDAEEERIVTTEEELEGFYIIKSIVREDVDVSRVLHRDTRSYMGVLLDNNNRKPICRLHFNNPSKKYIQVFGKGRKAERIDINGLDDLYNSCYAAGAGSGNWIVINCLKEACKAARYIWALS